MVHGVHVPQLAQGYASALASRRSQATHLYVVAIEKAAEACVPRQQQDAATITVVDMHAHGCRAAAAVAHAAADQQPGAYSWLLLMLVQRMNTCAHA